MPSLTELGNEIGKSVHKQLVINPKYEGLSYNDLETILLHASNKTLELLLKDKAAERNKKNEVPKKGKHEDGCDSAFLVETTAGTIVCMNCKARIE